MAFIFQPAIQPAIDVNGDRISGAYWQFDLAGTTTPTSVYTDEGLGTPLANPVVADSSGEFPLIFLDPDISYRARLYDDSDILLTDVQPYDVPVGDNSGVLSQLAATTGATLIGTDSGDTLQEFIDSLEGTGFFTPEQYGAVGDGVTNDTDAFTSLAAYVNANGGGVIEMGMGKTYLVGKQDFDSAANTSGIGYNYMPRDLLNFENLTKGIVIRGNGAKMKCAAGLYFGRFDASGNVTVTGAIASPYFYMISCVDCAGPIDIRNIELDGNNESLAVGGPYGDTGWQINCDGIFLSDCTGPITLENIHSHNHARDGFQLDGINAGETSRGEASSVRDCRFEHNSRQGLSLVGGKGWNFSNCTFSHTGRSSPTATTSLAIASNPGSGVDLEAEGGKDVRDIVFDNCEIINNFGPGMVSDQTDVARVTFRRCKIIGTTNYALWPNTPGFVFEDCLIGGTIVNARGGISTSGNPADAAKFVRCLFTTETAYSPTGSLFFVNNAFTESVGSGVSFQKCQFRYDRASTSGSVGGTDAVYYDTCIFWALAGGLNPYGRFIGGVELIQSGGVIQAFAGGGTPPDGSGGRNNSGHAEDNYYFTMSGVRYVMGATLDKMGNVIGLTNRGDVAVTLTPGTDTMVQLWNSANLTAARAVTLAAGRKGHKWRIVRTSGGAFNLNIGTGPIKALTAANQWAEVENNGSGWVLTAYGTL